MVDYFDRFSQEGLPLGLQSKKALPGQAGLKDASSKINDVMRGAQIPTWVYVVIYKADMMPTLLKIARF